MYYEDCLRGNNICNTSRKASDIQATYTVDIHVTFKVILVSYEEVYSTSLTKFIFKTYIVLISLCGNLLHSTQINVEINNSL